MQTQHPPSSQKKTEKSHGEYCNGACLMSKYGRYDVKEAVE